MGEHAPTTGLSSTRARWTRPTRALRISSSSTALQTGEPEVTEVPPSTEIVR
jgi:hypothetical protein